MTSSFSVELCLRGMIIFASICNMQSKINFEYSHTLCTFCFLFRQLPVAVAHKAPHIFSKYILNQINLDIFFPEFTLEYFFPTKPL